MTESAERENHQPQTPERHSTPKRHHYIPQMIQRRFAGLDLHLFSFDKRHPERGVERKPIRRLFQEAHLYTVRRLDGTRDTSTETRLSVIEGRAGAVIARAIEGARTGRPPAWSETDRKALVDLLVAQFRRSPDFHRNVLVERTAADIAADGIAKWEAAHGPVSPEERAYVTSPAFLDMGRRNALAANAADPLLRVAAILMQRGLSVAEIAAPGRSLILGSSPFARFKARSTGRQDLEDPEAELWLPLAPDVALCSYGFAGTEQVISITTTEDVRKFNLEIARQSTVIASACRDLIRSLAASQGFSDRRA